MLGRLEHHSVAGHEPHDHFAHGDGKWVIPGRNDPGDSNRVEVNTGLLIAEHGQSELFIAQEFFRFSCEVIHQVGDGHDFAGQRFDHGFTGFARNQAAEIILTVHQQVFGSENELTSLSERERTPGRLRCPGSSDRVLDLVRSKDFSAPKFF